MKKFFAGCGCLILLLILGAGFFVFRVASLARYGSEKLYFASQDYERANAANPFTPSGDGLLSERQIDRWLEARKSLAESGAAPRRALPTSRAQIDAMVAAGSMHIAALKKASMSFDEYMWIFDQVVAALDSAEARNTPEMAPVLDALAAQRARSPQARRGRGRRGMRPALSPAQSEHDLVLLAKQADRLVATMPALPGETFLAQSMRPMVGASANAPRPFGGYGRRGGRTPGMDGADGMDGDNTGSDETKSGGITQEKNAPAVEDLMSRARERARQQIQEERQRENAAPPSAPVEAIP